MKIAFCNIGYTNIVNRLIAKGFGFDLVKSSKPKKENIKKGISIAPEFACFPFKIITGRLIQALENGAELLVIPSGDSVFACQTSDFPVVHKYILKKMGYDFELIIIKDFSRNYIFNCFIKYNPQLTMKIVTEVMIVLKKKLSLLDLLDNNYRDIYLSENKKEAERYKRKWESAIEETDSILDVYKLKNRIEKDYQRFSLINPINLLKIGVVGDIFSLNEDDLNNKIFERLWDLGVYSERSVKPTVFFSGKKFGLDNEDSSSIQKAKGYLKHNVGGFSQHTIIKSIQYAEQGFDGIIHIYPFNCMPESVVRSILPKISQDFDIPVLYLSIDEQTGDAGYTTRIEAFVDLIKIRKNKKVKNG